MCHDTNQMTILTIDANECTSTPEKDGIMDLVEACGLINIYQLLHQDIEEFPTHINGSKVIDYIFGSPNILQYVHKVGYLRFHECFDSDHRGIYCDLSHHIFDINNNEDNITRKRAAGSNSTNKEGSSYAHDINEQFMKHNIYERSEKILNDIKTGQYDSENMSYQINVMDEFITSAMINAEKKCCKKKDPVLWTPEVYQSNLRVQYYNTRVKSERHRIYANTRLKDIIKKMDDNSKTILRNNKKHHEAALKQAIKDHNQLCKLNATNRREYLEQMVEDLRERNNSEHVTIRQILQRENSRNDFYKIKQTLNPILSKGIQHLDIPVEGENDKWVRITDQQTIEKAFLDRNKIHFGQAKSTQKGK
jgi:hypothetical protein